MARTGRITAAILGLTSSIDIMALFPLADALLRHCRLLTWLREA